MAQETTKKQSRTAVQAPLSRENLLKNHMQDKPWPWFYSFLKKYLPVMIPGLFMVVIASAIAIFNPTISGKIVDEVIEKAQYDKLSFYLILLIGLTVLRGVFRFSFTMLFEYCSQNTLFAMREAVFRRLMLEDFNFFNNNRTGDLLSRQTGDMDAVRHFIAFVIYQLFENGLLFILSLTMIIFYNWKLALALLVVLPFTAYTTYRQSKEVKPAFRRNRDAFSSLNTFAQENISGNRVIKAFAKEDFEESKFDKENKKFRDSQLASAKVWCKFIPRFEILSNVMTVVVLIVGGFSVIDGSMSKGDLVAVTGYLWMLNNPLRMVGWLVNDLLRFLTSLEKIHATYMAEPDIKTPDEPVAMKQFKGKVEFKHVYYNSHDEDILTDINFTALPGQTIGIIGATGSGKSSLVNLICRFYDANLGGVFVDDVDVKNMNINVLRSNIGMAMQDVFLFSDTIEGNISYGDPNCSFEDVERVAKIANADGFIREMPDGYDTIIGERGVGLSGGQKQRISLARALLKNPSILILDDTTSAIDMETEAQIQNELEAVSGDRTIFIIAHRISSIINADQILVIDGGKIIEQGTHDELLKMGGRYAKVFYNQYGEFEKIGGSQYGKK